MNSYFRTIIKEKTGASELTNEIEIQQLWSGYGKILRVGLRGATREHVVVKHIQLAGTGHHPRGWNSDIGHQRKVRSYEVERTWYDRYSANSLARLPQCIAIETYKDELLIVLEDLNEAGFSLRKQVVTQENVLSCLDWLAQFHASFLGQHPEGLWRSGTYWHLSTRPKELEALEDQRLKEAAPLINEKLNKCKYKTFVHGDAKLANFCFAHDGQVAGVDFQYVGGGCGMKDVAYFVGSCLDEKECERREAEILDIYFEHLQYALGEEIDELEREWRPLYHVAWADFHRFLKGWSPGHWKINSYSDRITREVIDAL